MTISIDFGNIWDAIGAIGTVGALFFSLFMVRSERKRNLSASFCWSSGNRYSAVLLISNLCNREIVLQSAELHYDGKLYPLIDFMGEMKYADQAELMPHETKKLQLKLPEDFCQDVNAVIASDDEDKMAELKIERPLKVRIFDIHGNHYNSKRMYSKHKLQELIFGQYLFTEDY